MQHLRLPHHGLEHVSFEWLRMRYGHLTVWAAKSSRVREDTTNSADGGLPEESMSLTSFLDGLENGASSAHDYVKRVSTN